MTDQVPPDLDSILDEEHAGPGASAPPPSGGWSAGRIVLLLLGCVGCLTLLPIALFAFAVTVGSCPHVYSYDGHAYRLDADALSGAFFAGAEGEDSDRLEQLAAVDGEYRLKVRNELEEIDYVDAMSLRVVDHQPGAEVLPALDGRLVTIGPTTPPQKCHDGKGRDMLGKLRATDGDLFVSRADDFPPGKEEPRERLTLEFGRQGLGDAAILVLAAHNTSFAEEALMRYLARMGPGLNHYLHCEEQSTDFRKRIADEIRRLGLALDVEVEDRGRLTRAAELRPVGPAVLRTFAVPVTLPRDGEATVRIQLSMSPLLWEIDRAALARALPTPQALVLYPQAAVDRADRDLAATLRSPDTERAVLHPGQEIDVRFEAPPESARELERTVVLSMKGYYETRIGGRGWLRPVAIIRHLTGWDSLPRYAVRLARESLSRRSAAIAAAR